MRNILTPQIFCVKSVHRIWLFKNNQQMVWIFANLFPGFSCICQPGYKTIKNFGGNNVECSQCKNGEVSDPGYWLFWRRSVRTACSVYHVGLVHIWQPQKVAVLVLQTLFQVTTHDVIRIMFSVYLDQSGSQLPSQTCLICSNNTMPDNNTWVNKVVIKWNFSCVTCRTTIKMLRASSLPESCICPNSRVSLLQFTDLRLLKFLYLLAKCIFAYITQPFSIP